MMYKAIGLEPKFAYAPTWFFDYVINGLQFLADLTQSEALEDAAETARIGKYYAVEDMLTTDPAEKYGTITMQDHFNKIAAQGQDPFTPVRATAVIAQVLESFKAVPYAILALYAMSNPKQVTVAGGLDFPLIIASLTGHNS